MELENNKSTHVKTTIALTSTLALLGTSVGVSNHVKADDMSAQDSGKNYTSVDSIAKPTTIAGTREAIKTSEETLKNQKADLNAVTSDIAKTNEEITSTEANISKAESNLAVAKDTLAAVSNVTEEEFNTLVETNKKGLEATNAQIVAKEAEKQQLAAQAKEQAQAVSSADNQSKQLAAQAQEADKKVIDLSNMVNQPEAITASAQKAENDIKVTATNLTKAENDLAAATSASTSQLNNELAANKASLSAKKSELSSLESGAQQLAVNVSGSNKMQVPTSFPYEEIKRLAQSGYIGTQSYMNAFNAMRNTLVNGAHVGVGLNNYVDIASDLNRLVDPDHLSVEVQNELALFAADMINSVRQHLGLPPVMVSVGSQDFARKLASDYKATHGNTIPNFYYGQQGTAGHYGIGPHDKTIIENSATSVGLIKNDDNMYENIGGFNDVHTVNGLKRSIFNSIRYMFFDDAAHGNTFGHAINFLRTDKQNPSKAIYLGLSASTVGRLNTHFVVFPESNIQNAGLFNKNLVSAPTSALNNAGRINSLKSDISNITTKIASLEDRLNNVSAEAGVVSAQQAVNSLKAQLETAKATSAKLNLQVLKMAQSKAGLQNELKMARASQQDVKSALDKSLASLSNAKVALNKTESALKVTENQLLNLVTKRLQLQKIIAFQNNPNRVAIAEENVATAQAQLNTLNSKLIDQKENLKTLSTTKISLLASITSSEQQLNLLENLLKEKTAELTTISNSSVVSSVASQSLSATTAPSVINNASLVSQVLAQKVKVEAQKTKAINPAIVTTIEDKTSQMLAVSSKLVSKSTTQLVRDILLASSQVAANQGLLEKVTHTVSQATQSIERSYGRSSETVGSIVSSQDESTKRAIRAGVVMLAAVGLSGYKLKKVNRKW
ncbi:SEC10/PgrA surface exclusion domain-containing protein [Streptococcus didelphis]|uniref:SEC10/PgrA surface exclusion domain-containing protein n=1 Tax=Streptococcus didelphis TaxID=102886 RepID=A0ABY9LFT1_9STRE|nr:SEC10/PgrA surface exclusion domain-containing protein [Streptococcus didelphis]WMB27768.1 SEC10/PgrA surface exclusion domain-containing protein [Streptococcus didelphis]